MRIVFTSINQRGPPTVLPSWSGWGVTLPMECRGKIIPFPPLRHFEIFEMHRPGPGRSVPFEVFSCGFAFMLNLSTLNSTWFGPVGKTYSVSPAGSGRYPYSGQHPPPYAQSPIPEPCSKSGKKAPLRKKTALAAEPCCALDSSWASP